MDIKAMTQLLQLYMMSNVSQGDETSASENSNSLGMFNLLLQGLLTEAQGQQTAEGSSQTAAEIPSVTDEDSGAVNLTPGGNNASSVQINSAIEQASQKYGVDSSFIKAIVGQESGFHSNAVSKAGAIGLMQLMPKTAESLGVKNPFDVLENIDGGTKYIKKLMDSFGGNKELALAAYNGGIGRMNRRGVDTPEEINRMPQETQNYVAKVMKKYEANKSI